MGRDRDAQEAWDKVSRLIPGTSLSNFKVYAPYKRPEDLDRVLTAARKGGLH
jgi:hypothetical protein